jgi:hypothetical protein
VQERLTKQIATAVLHAIQPAGVAVVIEACHMCMVIRGNFTWFIKIDQEIFRRSKDQFHNDHFLLSWRFPERSENKKGVFMPHSEKQIDFVVENLFVKIGPVVGLCR